MRARSRNAIRRCDGVRRLAPATAVGVGGRRSCRCGSAGQRGNRTHWAASRRHVLPGARNSASSRLAYTGGGACGPMVALEPKPMRTGRLLTADAPVAPRWCTRLGPTPCRCTGGVQPRRQAAGQRRRRRHGAALEPGLRPPRRHAAWATARAARSRAAGTDVLAGRGADHVMLVGLPHCGAPLTGNGRPGKQPAWRRGGQEPRSRQDMSGSALLPSLPGPLMRRRCCFRQCPRGALAAAGGV